MAASGGARPVTRSIIIGLPRIHAERLRQHGLAQPRFHMDQGLGRQQPVAHQYQSHQPHPTALGLAVLVDDLPQPQSLQERQQQGSAPSVSTRCCSSTASTNAAFPCGAGAVSG